MLNALSQIHRPKILALGRDIGSFKKHPRWFWWSARVGNAASEAQFTNFSNVPLDISLGLGLIGPAVASGLHRNPSSPGPCVCAAHPSRAAPLPLAWTAESLQLFAVTGSAHFTKKKTFPHSLRLKELEQISAPRGPNVSPTLRAES